MVLNKVTKKGRRIYLRFKVMVQLHFSLSLSIILHQTYAELIVSLPLISLRVMKYSMTKASPTLTLHLRQFQQRRAQMMINIT